MPCSWRRRSLADLRMIRRSSGRPTRTMWGFVLFPSLFQLRLQLFRGEVHMVGKSFCSKSRVLTSRLYNGDQTSSLFRWAPQAKSLSRSQRAWSKLLPMAVHWSQCRFGPLCSCLACCSSSLRDSPPIANERTAYSDGLCCGRREILVSFYSKGGWYRLIFVGGWPGNATTPAKEYPALSLDWWSRGRSKQHFVLCQPNQEERCLTLMPSYQAETMPKPLPRPSWMCWGKSTHLRVQSTRMHCGISNWNPAIQLSLRTCVVIRSGMPHCIAREQQVRREWMQLVGEGCAQCNMVPRKDCVMRWLPPQSASAQATLTLRFYARSSLAGWFLFRTTLACDQLEFVTCYED